MYYITQDGDGFDCAAIKALLEAEEAYVEEYEGRTGTYLYFNEEKMDLSITMRQVRTTGELWHGVFIECTPGLIVLNVHHSNPVARKIVAHILDNYSVSATDDEYMAVSLEPFVS